MTNRELVELLEQVADAYELKSVKWKPRAYRRASRAIESLQDDVDDIYEEKGMKGLEKIPGIGKSIAKHVAEYLDEGEVSKWEKLLDEVPSGSRDLLNLEGLGPERVENLHKKLGIKNLKDLKKAIADHKIQELEGFGKKTEENLENAVRMYESGQERKLLNVALPLAEEIIEYVKDNDSVKKIDYAGSLRRMKPTIGDVDILVVTDDSSRVMDTFTKMPQVKRVVSKGGTRSTVILKEGMQVDMRVFSPENYGAALQYFTGSKQHNIELRKVAIKKGYKLSEYGLEKKDGEKQIRCKTEKTLYKKLGFSFIPPELREANGELEAAKSGKIPKLVEIDDIRGDLQMHTKASDGNETIEAMATHAEELGYDYIAITDHSKSARIAHGLDEKRLKKQIKEIDKVAEKHNKLRILKSAEVDIDADGNLDYSEELLKELDLTVCSVHSNFKQSEKRMTERITAALENEYLDILAHPTGRMLQKREPVSLDLGKVFETAAENEKVLEINAQPHRLDLPDTHIRGAREYDILFSIDTDAHNSDQMHYMTYGVAQARRGWLTKKEIVNTFSLSKLRKVFKRISKS